MTGARQDMPGYDRYIASHDKYMACTYFFFLKCVFITFESSISCSSHVLCMLAYSNIRKLSKTWWWYYSYVPVIYLHIPLYTVIWQYKYDGICEYMSGYQGVRIPDEGSRRGSRARHSLWKPVAPRFKNSALLKRQILKMISRTMSRSICDNLEKDCLVAYAAANATHTRTHCRAVPFRWSGAFWAWRSTSRSTGRLSYSAYV